MILQQTRGNLSSGDQLALDLPFAATKSLAARIGPTPNFTRASAGTFVGSNGLIQSAAVNAARFDHDPVTGVCRGLLIEESRTNLLLQSDTLTTQTRTVTAVAHTLSFYGSGTVMLSGAHSATVVGTGDYPSRRTFAFTPTAGSLTLTVTGTVQFANLEAGSFATSYIPTTTASVVRSADLCSITGANFTNIWNGVDATVFFRGSRITNQAGQNSWSLSSNTLATNVSLNRGTTFEFTSFGGTGLINTTGFSIGSEYKTATALRSGNYAASFNGAAAIVSSNSFALVFNTLNIGSNYPGNGQLNGWIHNIKFYKKRLDNAKLQALTV